MSEPSAGRRPNQRKLRNLLVDAPMQLRLSARVVIVTVIAAALLFVGFVTTVEALFTEIDEELAQRSRGAELH